MCNFKHGETWRLNDSTNQVYKRLATNLVKAYLFIGRYLMDAN